MKTLIALSLFCASLGAQTVSVNLSIPMQVSVLADIHQHFISQTTGTLGALAADMDASTATVTVVVSQAALTAQAPVVAVGNSVILGLEPMKVSVVSTVQGGIQLTLLRGGFPSVTMAAHPANTTVALMKYATAWDMLLDEALRPWTLGVIQSLGNKSLTLASGATGSVTP